MGNLVFTATVIVGIIIVAGILFFSRYSLAMVKGRSMEPTLYHGDICIVDRKRTFPQKGAIYVLTSPSYITVIKRVAYVSPSPDHPKYVWVLGDNLPMSEDSRIYGFVDAKDIIGEVVMTWKLLRRK